MNHNVAAQLGRLKCPIEDGQRFLFRVVLKQHKNGNYGYKVIRKSHYNLGEGEWKGGVIDLNLELYSTTGTGFPTIEKAVEDAERWIERYKVSTREPSEQPDDVDDVPDNSKAE